MPGTIIATLAEGEFGVRELLLAGGAIGIGVLLVAWGIFSRKREVPGHARDGAENLTRELIDELEARAERLERLIERAEAMIGEYRELEQRPAAKTLILPEPKPGFGATARGEASIFTDPMHREVCGMADDGMSPVEIARRLQMPTGQVELILNLRGRRATASA